MRAACVAAALCLLGCDDNGVAPCAEQAVVECVFAVAEGLDTGCRRGRDDYPATGCCDAVERQLQCFGGCRCDQPLGEGAHLKLMLLDTPLIAFGGLAEEVIDNYVQAAHGLCGPRAPPGGMTCGSPTGGLV